LINLNLKNKLFLIKIRYLGKPNNSILDILYRFGIIKNFINLNKKLVIIFNFMHNTLIIKNIKLLSNSVKNIFLKRKIINYLILNNYNHSIILLSDHKIITLNEAKIKKIGGILLAKFI
jgi:ribosomal protein S8